MARVETRHTMSEVRALALAAGGDRGRGDTVTRKILSIDGGSIRGGCAMKRFDVGLVMRL